MSTTSKQRYRPALTPEEIAFLAKKLKLLYIESFTASLNESGDAAHAEVAQAEQLLLSLMNKFAALDAKITHSVVAPAYSTKEPAPSLLEDLGEPAPVDLSLLTPAQRRLVAYEKYVVDVTPCNAQELEDALEHKFQVGLMKPEEAKAYEAKVWASTERELAKHREDT
jgi:hypothetical protein